MNLLSKRIAVAALVLSVGAILTNCTASRNGTEATTQPAAQNTGTMTVGTALGNIAPDFQLASMDNSPVSLAALRGQPAVLVFWTAWCPSCKEEAPHINELAAKYEPRGVRVLGINIQDSPARTESGIKDFGIRYPVARDADALIARRYNVTGTPTIVFLDKRGTVRHFANEFPADYAQQLDALLVE